MPASFVDSDTAILNEMIKSELQMLANAVRKSLERSRKVCVEVCSKDEINVVMKNIDKLQEVTAQATETTASLSSEVQALRLSLYEAFAMSAEAQTKLDLLNK